MGLYDSIRGFFSPDGGNVKSKIKQTEKEISKRPNQAHIVNRFYSSNTEVADEGIYGYPTRSYKWQLDGARRMELAYQQTPKIRSSYNRLKTRVFSVPLTIEAADDSEEAQELKAYNEQILAEIKGSINDSLSELAMSRMYWGYSLAEIVPKMSEYPEFEGKRVISEILPKIPGLFQFVTNQYDQVEYVQSLVDYTPYSLNRLIVMNYDAQFGNVYGNAQWNALSSLVALRESLFRNMGVFSNWYTMPIASVKFPSGDDDLRVQAEAIADNLIAGTNLAMPDQVKAEFINAGVNNKDLFTGWLNWIDDQISESIAGYDLSQETGARAADEVKSNELQAFVDSVRRYVEEVYNEQIIRRFTAHNYDKERYPLSKYPKARLAGKEQIDREKESQIIERLLANGILDLDNPTHKQYIHNRLELPKVSSDEMERLRDSDFSKFETDIDNYIDDLYSNLPDEVELKFESKVQGVTNFPENGDDKKVSLRNSNYALPPRRYLESLKEDYPQIWKEGGNIRGNEAYNLGLRALDGDESKAVIDWIHEREAWMARHYKNHNLAGVVAQLKWWGVGSRGFDYQKEIIEDEKDRIESKADFEQNMWTGEMSPQTLKAIENKVNAHNDKYPNASADLSKAIEVFRRGVAEYKENDSYNVDQFAHIWVNRYLDGLIKS